MAEIAPISVKKYPNLNECPEKLKKMLERFQLLPFIKENLLRVFEFGSRSLRLASGEENSEIPSKAKRELLEKTEHLPEEFRNFIFYGDSRFDGKPGSPFYLIDAIHRYENFLRQQEILLLIVLRYGQDKNFEGLISDWIFPATGRMRIERVEVKKGKKKRKFRELQFESKPDEFIESLRGVEVKRIKICEICSRIFWAGRITQKGCNKECANRVRAETSKKSKRVHRTDYVWSEYKKAAKKNKK